MYGSYSLKGRSTSSYWGKIWNGPYIEVKASRLASVGENVNTLDVGTPENAR